MNHTPSQEPGWGDRLLEAHDTLRQFVATAQTTADPPSGTASTLAEQLRTHCQTACAYLHGHHTTEDTTFFPHLAQKFPELQPTLNRLRQEHTVIDRIITELENLTDHPTQHPADPTRARGELDRLSTELETHFAYEERHLVPALNALTGPVPWDPPD